MSVNPLTCPGLMYEQHKQRLAESPNEGLLSVLMFIPQIELRASILSVYEPTDAHQ